MRIGLIAANKRTATGELRAELMLAGQSVLGWQVDFLRAAGAERIICLSPESSGEVLRKQHEAERAGISFHALRGFAAVPALVRAEDDLMVLCDGLLPDPEVAAHLFAPGQPRHFVARTADRERDPTTLPDDLERIDAACHWAGFLVMRGAAAARLSEFPADADAISLLLRLALQAHTPRRDWPGPAGSLLVADSLDAVAREEQARLARLTPARVWSAPFVTLAEIIATAAVTRGPRLSAAYAGAFAIAFLTCGAALAAYGLIAPALAAAAAGLFGGQVWRSSTMLTLRLRRTALSMLTADQAGGLADVAAAAILFLALVPEAGWTPLAICGPLLIGLAILASREEDAPISAMAKDRTSLMLTLCLAAFAGVLPTLTAGIAAVFMVTLLLRRTAG